MLCPWNKQNACFGDEANKSIARNNISVNPKFYNYSYIISGMKKPWVTHVFSELY